MPVFHFSFGNSAVGPIGFCAAVRAKNRREAVARLRFELPTEFPIVKSRTEASGGVEYVQIYLNPGAIRTADIDFLEQH